MACRQRFDWYWKAVRASLEAHLLRGDEIAVDQQVKRRRGGVGRPNARRDVEGVTLPYLRRRVEPLDERLWTILRGQGHGHELYAGRRRERRGLVGVFLVLLSIGEQDQASRHTRRQRRKPHPNCRREIGTRGVQVLGIGQDG